MLSNDFENKVQQKLEELTFTPGDAVWDKVAASLPPEKKDRRFIFFLFLFAALLCGAFFFWNNTKTSPKIIDEKVPPAVAVTQNDKTIAKTNPGKPAVANTTDPVKKTQPVIKKKSASISKTIATAPAKMNAVSTHTHGITTNKMDGNDATIVAIITAKKKPEPVAETMLQDVNTTVVENEKITEQSNIIQPQPASSIVVNETPATGNSLAKIDSVITKSVDSSLPAIVSITSQKKHLQKWTYGLEAAAGRSNAKGGLFTNKALFSDQVTSSSGGNSFPSSGSQPHNPSSSFTFSFGLFAEKTLGKKFTLHTGISYTYQSNKISVGKRVDSAINLNYDNRNFVSGNYFRSGQTENYTNKFHLLQLPVLFRYHPLNRIPVYLEAGPAFSYLVQSNALQYNGSTAAYFTNSIVFNKLLVSLAAGAGITLGNPAKFPVSIGYRFSYNPASVTKEPFGKQHLSSSLLYLDIPLKK